MTKIRCDRSRGARRIIGKDEATMYTPESHDQMFEILSALRTYAAAHAMPDLAEMMDDALVILADEGREALSSPPLAPHATDGR
jgi:hypothetical protein